MSRRETRADPTRERDLMAPAKKSGTRASARVRKPPSVAGDFEYDVDRISRAKARRAGTKRVGAKKVTGGYPCACGGATCGRVGHEGNYRRDCAYRIANNLECDASGKGAKRERLRVRGYPCACDDPTCGRVGHEGNYRRDCKYRIANNLKCDATGKTAVSRGHPCACGGSDCGRVSYKGNYREDCEYRIANDLKCDATGKQAEYDARPEVMAARARYEASPARQAQRAVEAAKCHLEDLAAREKHKLWKESLEPWQFKLVDEAERAIKAVKDAESDRWAADKIYANGICASLAKSHPALAFIFGREWVGTRLICADGEWAKSAMRVKDLGGLLFHATNVAPDRLELVDGEPFMLRPSRKKYQWGNTRYVYGSFSNDASLPISFVEGHNGKRFVSLAREQPASNAVYLYIFDQRHAQYEDFHQVYKRGKKMTQAMRFFARCCKPVAVARGTPGVTVLKIFWKEGAPDVPYVEVLYGEPVVPDFSLNWDAASPEARAFSERAVASAAKRREKRKAKLEGRAPPARKRKAPATAPPAKRSKLPFEKAVARRVEERLRSYSSHPRADALVSLERFKTLFAKDPSWPEKEPSNELAGLTRSIIELTEAVVRKEMAGGSALS